MQNDQLVNLLLSFFSLLYKQTMYGYCIVHVLLYETISIMLSGTYCQQREVEAITEGVEENEGTVQL